jgi:site-specific recombinase XerD
MEHEEGIAQFRQYLNRRFPGRRTVIDYVSDVRQFVAVCDKPWRSVTLKDIDAFVDQQRESGLQPATIQRRVAALKTLFDFLAEESGDLGWPNPVRYRRHAGKAPKRLPRDLSDAQVQQLEKVITDERDRAWFLLMLRAGLRVGEVVGLTLFDLITPASAEHPAQVRVCGKGQKERMVLLCVEAYEQLQAWLNVRPAVEAPQIFLNGRGRPLTANGLEWLLRGYGERIGMHLTPHQLRHTFGRQMTEQGMPIPSLGKLLGHARISTTQIYTAGADPQLAQAYQTAMTRLAGATADPDRPTATPPPPASSTPPKPEEPPPAPPPLPNGEDWALDLPADLRQDSFNYVHRRALAVPPKRQRLLALHDLGEFRRFWIWQLAHRPITQAEELSLADLQAYQTARMAEGKAISTINNTVKVVRNLLRELAEQGRVIDASIFRLHVLPQPDSLPRYLTEGESQCLEDYVRTRDVPGEPGRSLENACFFVLAHTGLRARECVELQVQDLDVPGRRLLVREGKGRKDRVVYMTAVAADAVVKYLEHMPHPATGPLWLRRSGRPITYQWLHARMVALGQAAGGVDLTPHRLRHTLATRLLNAGMEITRIQKLLGHQEINTTMVYARVFDATVEADYRRAMQQNEHQPEQTTEAGVLASDWPIRSTKDLCPAPTICQAPLDNSV